jgi:hypothetical protein
MKTLRKTKRTKLPPTDRFQHCFCKYCERLPAGEYRSLCGQVGPCPRGASSANPNTDACIVCLDLAPNHKCWGSA